MCDGRLRDICLCCARPRARSTAAVQKFRKGAVALLTGTDPIDGIDSHVTMRESTHMSRLHQRLRASP